MRQITRPSLVHNSGRAVDREQRRVNNSFPPSPHRWSGRCARTQRAAGRGGSGHGGSFAPHSLVHISKESQSTHTHTHRYALRTQPLKLYIPCGRLPLTLDQLIIAAYSRYRRGYYRMDRVSVGTTPSRHLRACDRLHDPALYTTPGEPWTVNSGE